MKYNSNFIKFLSGYSLGAMTYSLLITLSVWIVVKTYGNQLFNVSSLVALIIVTLCTMRFSHFLDKFSRKRLILGFYGFNGLCLFIALLFDQIACLSLIIVVTAQLSIGVFYTGYSAIAQNFTGSAYHRLNAIMEMTSQFSALLAGVFIYFFIHSIDINKLLWVILCLLFISSLVLSTLCDTCLVRSKAKTKNTKPRALTWFFTHPVAWLPIVGLFPYLIIMAMNQIQPIYFYQLMELKPDALAVSSMIYILGTFCGSWWASRTSNYSQIIYIALILTATGCIVLAIAPVQGFFYGTMYFFGVANSSARIASNSFTMQHIDNTEIGTFNGLKSSLAFMVRLSFLVVLNGLFPFFDYQYSSYLLPVIILYLPLVYVMVVWLRLRH